MSFSIFKTKQTISYIIRRLEYSYSLAPIVLNCFSIVLALKIMHKSSFKMHILDRMQVSREISDKMYLNSLMFCFVFKYINAEIECDRLMDE